MCKIASGRISLQELTFAREFRGLHGYRPGACVPALELTRYDLHNICPSRKKNAFPTKLFIYLSIHLLDDFAKLIACAFQILVKGFRMSLFMVSRENL